MEAIPPEESNNNYEVEYPDKEVLEPAENSSKVKYSGDRVVIDSGSQAQFVPSSNDIGRDDSRPSDGDLRLDPVNRAYECDSTTNYVRYVDFIRQDIVSENSNGVLKCQKSCNEHATWCTGFFYMNSADETYCAFLSTPSTEGTRFWMKAHLDSQVCFAN